MGTDLNRRGQSLSEGGVMEKTRKEKTRDIVPMERTTNEEMEINKGLKPGGWAERRASFRKNNDG